MYGSPEDRTHNRLAGCRSDSPANGSARGFGGAVIVHVVDWLINVPATKRMSRADPR